MRKELFEFRHIVKHIGGHAALRDVSLRLYQDEITFLVGRGSGRSVLSQMMMGELTPDSGTMLLLEKPYQPLSPEKAHERGIFCVTQNTKLIQNLSLSENTILQDRFLASGTGVRRMPLLEWPVRSATFSWTSQKRLPTSS